MLRVIQPRKSHLERNPVSVVSASFLTRVHGHPKALLVSFIFLSFRTSKSLNLHGFPYDPHRLRSLAGT